MPINNYVYGLTAITTAIKKNYCKKVNYRKKESLGIAVSGKGLLWEHAAAEIEYWVLVITPSLSAGQEYFQPR